MACRHETDRGILLARETARAPLQDGSQFSSQLLQVFRSLLCSHVAQPPVGTRWRLQFSRNVARDPLVPFDDVLRFVGRHGADPGLGVIEDPACQSGHHVGLDRLLGGVQHRLATLDDCTGAADRRSPDALQLGCCWLPPHTVSTARHGGFALDLKQANGEAAADAMQRRRPRQKMARPLPPAAPRQVLDRVGHFVCSRLRGSWS
jgi:hypothetical protein